MSTKRTGTRWLASVFLILAGVVALPLALTAAPVPIIYYDFDDIGTTSGGFITNKSPLQLSYGILQGNAMFIAWTNGAPGGASPGGGLWFSGLSRANGGTYVETTYTPDEIAIRDNNYTMAAWVNISKTSGDAMVFGQATTSGGDWLHNGIRDASPHIGHYGSDLTSGTDLAAGTWYHVVWQYNMGVELIYINGQWNAAEGGKVPIRLNNPLIIGSTETATSGRDYAGILDELVVYDEALAPAQIAFLAGGGSPTNLPEVPFTRAFFTGPYGTNGTWNLYEAVAGEVGLPATWYEAYLASTNLDPVTGSGLPGHLVTIGSKFEQAFVRRLQRIVETNTYREAYAGDTWIGLTDNDTNTVGLVFPGAHESGNATTQPDENIRKTNGWVWVNGEPYDSTTYMNWNGGEPNDSPAEDVVQITAGGGWNDLGSGIPGSPGEGSPWRMYVVEWDIGAADPIPSGTEIVRTVTPVLPPTLPGPAPTNGSFSGYCVQNAGTVGSVRQAVERLLSGAGTITQTDTGIPTLNAYDPDNGAINAGLFPNNKPFFANTAGVDDEDCTIVHKGRIVVKPEDAGPWTFGVHADDGFALRIRGQTWQKAYGLGIIDHADRSILSFEDPTGDANTRGVINLAAGTYDLEFVFFERGGGFVYELYAAKGDWENDGDTDTWRLVGHTSCGVEPIAGIVDPGDGNGWTVWWNPPDQMGAITDTTTAWNAVAPYIGVAGYGTNAPAINFYDPDNGSADEVVPSVPFPLDTMGVDDNNFGLYMEGQLLVPSNATYAIGFRGDDGGWLQIEGQTWDSLVANATGLSVINGDMMVCDQPTGDSRTVGLITLNAGTYTIRSLFMEMTGGGSYDIFTMGANCSTSSLPTSFASRSLSTGGTGVVVDAAATLELESSTPPEQEYFITEGRLTASGQTVQLSWESVPGATYALEACTNLVAGEWMQVQGGIVSGGTNTTYSFTNTMLAPYAFIRVKKE